MGANRSSSFVRILELFCEDQVRETSTSFCSPLGPKTFFQEELCWRCKDCVSRELSPEKITMDQPVNQSCCQPVISKSVPPTNSMIETAKATNLDPYRYLTWVLTNASILASSGYDWTTGLQPAHTTDHCRSPYRYVSDFEKRAEHGSFSHTCILRSLRFSHEKRPTHISESVFLSG